MSAALSRWGRRLFDLSAHLRYDKSPMGTDMRDLERITLDPAVMGGKPCIRGQRVTVGMIVGQIAAGAGIEEILADYPYIEPEDIVQALRYAAWRAEEREIPLAAE